MRALTVEQARDYINAIDFSMIIDKMVKHQGWKRKEAEAVCKLYRNFLFLQKKYDNQGELPPSEDMDEFWHNHILDTDKYHKDCERIYGYYLHHYPYFGIDGKTDMNDLQTAYDKTTQALHLKEFGFLIPRVRKLKVLEMIKITFEIFKRMITGTLVPKPGSAV